MILEYYKVTSFITIIRRKNTQDIFTSKYTNFLLILTRHLSRIRVLASD